MVFDTGQGDRIGPDHLLASCGFLPDFAPVDIDGRLLGDGGLVANAPVHTALVGEGHDRDVLCFVIDLFSPEGARPANLEAAARRWDLLFGNQSRQEVQSLELEYRLRWALGLLAEQLGPKLRDTPETASALAERVERPVTLLHLSYHPDPQEAGPEKPFDFSRASLADRWEAGSADMEEAIRLAGSTPPPTTGFEILRIQRHRSAPRGSVPIRSSIA